MRWRNLIVWRPSDKPAFVRDDVKRRAPAVKRSGATRE